MATAMPLVSVILPTFDRPGWLPRAVGSVLDQTCPDFELIVIDDGSPEDVGPALAPFDDDRICLVKLPQNRGLSAARNAGIEAARGEYLAFQDDDDVWHPEKLERQLHVLVERPEVGVVYSDMHRIHRDGRKQYFHSPPIERGRWLNPETGYWQTYMLAMQPTLIRRAALGAERFDESLVFFEDLDLHLRLSRRHAYAHQPEPLVDYYDTAGMTADRTRELRGRWQMLRKHFPDLRRREPAFLVREAVSVLLRRSILPIAQAHWTDLGEEAPRDDAGAARTPIRRGRAG